MDKPARDPLLFAGTAEYYQQGRLAYADDIVDWLGALLEERGLRGRGGLLDVGCGPGTLTVPLATLFPHALGVDPDPGMIELARRFTDVSGVEFRCERAEDMVLEPGAYAVSTFGQSFHWTDREYVAGLVRDALVLGGVFALVTDVKSAAPQASTPRLHPDPPTAAVAELLVRWLGPVRRAGASGLPHGTPAGEEEILRQAGYIDEQRVVLGGGEVIARSVDDLVAGVFSRSDGAPHLFGDRRADFEAELRQVLNDASDDGWFEHVHPGTEVRIWSSPGPRDTHDLGSGDLR